MPALPALPHDPTLTAMNAAIEADGNRDAARPYLGMSGIGKPCRRAIWYEFRWATKRQIAASGLRAIQDGFVNEDITAARLQKIPGIELWTTGEDGQQIGCEDLSGHFRGHLDGVIQGLLQAPKTAHVWENKAVNEKKFNALKKLIADLGEKQALREWDATYFAQAQLYMHYQGLTRHYLTVNTPGGRDTVSCRTEYDKASAQHFIDLAKQIIASEGPPMRMSEDPAYWQCKWCDHHAVCHLKTFPQPTCRSCAHVTPMLDEPGGWHCRKWEDRIPVETQRIGCDQHLYHPEILPHLTPVNGNMDENWVNYEDKKTGETLTNGPVALGKMPSAALYALHSPSQPLAAAVPDDSPAALLNEFSADCGIAPDSLIAGALNEDQDWPNVTRGVERFFSRWQHQPAKLSRLRALMEVIDSAHVQLMNAVERRVA